MKERAFMITLVVVVAVFVGVVVAIQGNNAPAIRQLAEQQSRMASALHRLEERFAQPQAQAEAPDALETKLTALDKKIGELLEIYKKFEKAQDAQRKQQGPDPQEYTKVHEIPRGESPPKGNPDAPVTITSFIDFECPFSARFQPVIDSVLEAYPKKVNYVLKHFPLAFHKMARPAGKAVLAAGEQGKYWEMAALIFKNNRGLTDEKIEGFAKELGLKMKKFKKSYADEDGKWEKLIQDDYALGMKVQVRGTPTYFINGRKTRARNLDSFKKEIDPLLEKKAE